MVNHSTSVEGFRASSKLASYNSGQVWHVFAALIGANAFFVGLSGFVIAFTPRLVPAAPVVLAAFGFITCVGWFFVTARAFGYVRYYFAWARLYEGQLQEDPPGMVRQGARFAEGHEVTVGDSPHRLGWWARLLKVQWVVTAVIVMFIAIYAFVFWYSIFGLSVASTP